MSRYGMYHKNGRDLIHITYQETLEQATEYFLQLKKLPKEEFDKIFIVLQIKIKK